MYKGYELSPLIRGKLLKRYKRFLADIELENGEVVTAHCPNSGSMKGCARPGAEAWISQSTNPKRKLKYTWELTRIDGTFIGINTLVPNRLVKASVENDLIPELSGYSRVSSEVKTSEHTRLDLMLEDDNKKPCFVEIKNCTLVENGGGKVSGRCYDAGAKAYPGTCGPCCRGTQGSFVFPCPAHRCRYLYPGCGY